MSRLDKVLETGKVLLNRKAVKQIQAKALTKAATTATTILKGALKGFL